MATTKTLQSIKLPNGITYDIPKNFGKTFQYYEIDEGSNLISSSHTALLHTENLQPGYLLITFTFSFSDDGETITKTSSCLLYYNLEELNILSNSFPLDYILNIYNTEDYCYSIGMQSIGETPSQSIIRIEILYLGDDDTLQGFDNSEEELPTITIGYDNILEKYLDNYVYGGICIGNSNPANYSAPGNLYIQIS